MLPEMNPDEVNPAAPIALVTMEIRHPATDSLTESSHSELKARLVDHLPIERQAQDVSWGMIAPGTAPQPTAERFIRYVNRENTIAASMRNQAIVVETTAYTSFETFLEIVMQVVDARAHVSSIVWSASDCATCSRFESPSAWTAESNGATGSTSRCSVRGP
jgi:uncharacterized protein (TIGR04255 family)